MIRMGEKIQDNAYRVNQLLERRVNEWLGNYRSSRYLFNLGDLWSIEKQKPNLIWGSKQRQKQKLLAQSKRRIYRNFGLLGGVLALLMGIGGWLHYTAWGQVTQIRWKLTNVSQQISDSQYQSKAVAAFVKDQNFSQAFKLVNQIKHPSYRANALRTIAETYNKLNQPDKAAELLQDAGVSAKQIENSDDRANVLRTIAETYNKLKRPDKAAELLQDVIAAANQIENSSYRADVLEAITEVYSKLNQPEKAVEVLQSALAIANQIESSDERRTYTLINIAEVAANLKQPKIAVEVLQDAIASANQIESSSDRANALITIAQAAANLTNWGQALKAVQQCPSNDCEVELLANVLTVYAEQQHPELKEKVMSNK